MKKTLLLYLLSLFAHLLPAQQLYLEGFIGRNRTAFDLQPYDNPQWFSPFGARAAFGADHVQLGAEYHQSLLDPEFTELDVLNNPRGASEFTTTYYGAFVRTKICRYPAMRFGLVLRAGAGIYDTERTSNSPLIPRTTTLDQQLGFNAGAGVSIPLMRPLMIELGYTYYYVDYEAVEGQIAAMNGSYHAVQVGLSFNFVFGKRADAYRHLQENRRWENGWRG